VRILTVGIDVSLLTTRQALLVSSGYDSLIATPVDFDEKLHSGKFDLVILSAMLTQEEKRLIHATSGRHACAGVGVMVWPNELLRMLAEALG
jgi:ABC-type amino acid transport substrate-binding protein